MIAVTASKSFDAPLRHQMNIFIKIYKNLFSQGETIWKKATGQSKYPRESPISQERLKSTPQLRGQNNP